MEYIYAALLLHKQGQDITEDNMNKVISATGKEVDESKVKSLVASLKDVNIDEELANAIVASAAPASGTSDSAPAVEEKKEEKAEASAAGLSSLFG
jgi:large subunit ribosomal protein L12